MPRLPVPGSDINTWGGLLNEYLRVAHDENGALRRQASLDRADRAVPKGDLAHNVKDYGAVGDGAKDDTAAIRAAITAAKASTKKVYIPPGTYKISGALDVGGGFPGGLTVYGNGWDSQIKLAPGANCYAFTFNNTFTPGAAIKDLTIDCNGGAQSAGGGIDAEGACICFFERLHIDRPWFAGIYIHHDGNGGYGRQNVISGCHIENGRDAAHGGAGHALIFEASDENRIVNCTFTDCGNASVAENTMIYERAGLQLFHGNAFVGGATGGSQLKLEGGNSLVVGNTFDGGNSGSQLLINGNNNLAVGNRYHNIGSAAASNDGRAGVVLDNVSGCLVANSTFAPIASGQGYADSAIKLIFGAHNNAIHSNVVAGDWRAAAINMDAAGTGNTLRANAGHTVQITTPSVPASDAVFTNNFETDCTIYIHGGTVSDVAINGSATGVTAGAFRVSVGHTIKITYTSAPQWTWIGD